MTIVVVRGFLDRRRVKKLWAHAAEEINQAKAFLDQMATLNLSFVDTLHKRIQDDVKIPKGTDTSFKGGGGDFTKS